MKAFNNNKNLPSGQVVKRLTGPNKLTRYAFYGVIFAFPWESLEIGLGENFSLAKLLGLFFFGVALLQPKICYRFPPKAFWLFILYLALYALLALREDSSYDRNIFMKGFSIAQMTVLFWLSYNVLRDERVVKGFLLALIGACLSLVVVGFFVEGIHTSVEMGGNERLTVLGQNPGTTGATLALGLIALFGMAYGRLTSDLKTRLLTWLPFLILAGFLISTGSRGAMLSLAIGIAFFLLKGGNLQSKIALGLIVAVGLGTLFLLTFYFHPDTLNRIEKSMTEGDTAGRDVIYIEAAEMVNERPLMGWGPLGYRLELGKRVGWYGKERDAHNLLLKIFLEVGIVGAIPYFLGIGSCAWAAWKARGGLQGALPLSMLATVLMINMSQPWDNRKIFWIILAYALGSARWTNSRRSLKIDSNSDQNNRVGFRKYSKSQALRL